MDRQREGEIERQRAELAQQKERLALMCRQVLEREMQTEWEREKKIKNGKMEKESGQ